jgi:hypothetical protein
MEKREAEQVSKKKRKRLGEEKQQEKREERAQEKLDKELIDMEPQQQPQASLAIRNVFLLLINWYIEEVACANSSRSLLFTVI